MMNTRVFIALASLLALAYLVVLALQPHIFQSIPGYFWHFMALHITPIPNWWFLALIAPVGALIVRYILRRPDRAILNVALLISLGYFLQMSFGFIPGVGLNGIRSTLIQAGHFEFVAIAAVESDMFRIASEYEDFCKSDSSLQYVHTKPPGQLLFYMLTQKASNIVSPRHTLNERLERLVTFVSIVYPLLTYLVLIPLYLFGKLISGKRDALIACCLYTVIPSVTLVTFHLDQVVYPLTFMTAVYTAAKSVELGNWKLGVVTGLLIYLAIYLSFSLLPLVPLILSITLIHFYAQNKGVSSLHSLTAALGGLASGLLVLLLIGLWLLDYNPITRYDAAMEYHRIWKDWQPGILPSITFAGLNLIEFAWWSGLPLIVLFVTGMLQAVRALCNRQVSTTSLITLITAGMLMAMAVFGQTKGEVARLWIFAMPLVCLGAGTTLARIAKKNIGTALYSLMGLQLVIVLLLKQYQDFW